MVADKDHMQVCPELHSLIAQGSSPDHQIISVPAQLCLQLTARR